MKKKKQASEEYTGLRCPKCRAPVPAGAGRCTRCNTLLDPDTGQARTRLTDVDMLELVEASRRARTKGIGNWWRPAGGRGRRASPRPRPAS